MTASLTPNRETALAAMWWLYEGATIFATFADTTGASPAPDLSTSWEDWFDYLLDSSYDIFLTGGSVGYDATLTERAELPQLEIVVDFDTSITYTDILIFTVPAVDPGVDAPTYAFPYIGVIHEPTAVTVGASESKTYRVDLFSEWL